VEVTPTLAMVLEKLLNGQVNATLLGSSTKIWIGYLKKSPLMKEVEFEGESFT
jgi:hypothetical protein